MLTNGRISFCDVTKGSDTSQIPVSARCRLFLHKNLLIPPLSIHVKHEQSKRQKLQMREGCKQRAKHRVWANLRIIQRVSATDKDVKIRKVRNSRMRRSQRGVILRTSKPKRPNRLKGSTQAAANIAAKCRKSIHKEAITAG